MKSHDILMQMFKSLFFQIESLKLQVKAKDKTIETLLKEIESLKSRTLTHANLRPGGKIKTADARKLWGSSSEEGEFDS